MSKDQLVKRPWLDLNRKVESIGKIFLIGLVVLVALIAAQESVLAESEAIGDLIGLLMTALGGLATALVAAYATSERAG